MRGRSELPQRRQQILDVWIGGTRKMIWVQAITVWFVVLFVPWIVN
jgi:hypothetical protein